MRTPIRTVITSRGGLAATHELYAAGWDRHSLGAAVRGRAVIRARQGWYCLPELHPTLLRAVRVGGPATCTTGLELHGAWVVRGHEVHVRVGGHDSRLRSPHDRRVRLVSGAVVHWREAATTARLLLDPIACLQDSLACRTPELVAATADSVLRSHPHLASGFRAMATTAPARSAVAFSLVDGVCESGTETVVWQRLGARMGFRRQVHIPRVGRIDFLVGERLVIEVDGFEYHSDPERFEDDRRRDAVLSVLGYRVLRFSHKQVFKHWTEVEAAILGARARGDHY